VDLFREANARFNLAARLVVLTRQSRVSPDPAVCFHRGDVRSFQFPEGDFSYVIHGANAVFDEPALEETILAGTDRVLCFCAGRRPAKLLYLSSGAVYGARPSRAGAIAEDSPLGPPASRYARAKQIAESMCGAFPATIARGFAFIGPRLPLDGGFAAGNFLRDRLARRPLRVEGNGRAVRSYLYASDLAAWLWTLLFRGEAGRVYNVGSDQAVTVRELARRIAAPVGLPVEVRGGETGDSYYVPSIERARRELGLEVRVGLDEAIRRTVEWHLSTPRPV